MNIEVSVSSIDWDSEGATGLPNIVESLVVSVDEGQDLDDAVTEALTAKHGFCIISTTYEVVRTVSSG